MRPWLALGGFAAAAAAVWIAWSSHGTEQPKAAASPLPPSTTVSNEVDVGAKTLTILAGSAEVLRATPRDGDAVLTGDGVRTVEGGATLGADDGTRIHLEKRTEFRVEALGRSQKYLLVAGAVRLDVAGLPPGERLAVVTKDAEIEVHGTSFRVADVPPDARCGEGTTTRVSVTEGIVTVRARGTMIAVAAGGAWPSGCDQAPNRAPAPAAPPVPATKKSAPSSDLVAQNDLFAEAIAEKRRGRTEAAILAFQQLQTRYPASPLAESADAERLKLLRGHDPARAKAAAREYLSRYPGGFARTDATRILNE
jgi:ferric-dicitrate binding protein FerR (iron transport regulator)